MNADVVFLPWVRQGAAAAIPTLDTLGANLRGAVDLSIELTINAADGPTVPVRLRGPADVVGIDTNEIVRVDPRPGTTDFEPNYFVAIEFDRPDFPWLFTPARADANGRLRPWLCLVVVRKQNGVTLFNSGDAPLPALEISAPAKVADELPDLSESWAWAHSQTASPASAAELSAALAGRPELSLSRLLCPRLLTPHTDYIACLVPTFELGRKAGLGLEIQDTNLTSNTGLQPAWPSTTTPDEITLPVYHQWQFRTGQGGDFESLVRLLQARTPPVGLGNRPIAIDRPGFELPQTFPGDAQLDLEGALRPMGSSNAPLPWPTAAEEPFQAELEEIVNAPGNQQTIDPRADPLLAPPLYGRWYAARSTAEREGTPWFDELNLDPRHRSVAAFGTRVVQEHQEALMAAAWEQAADLQQANQRLRQLQLSLVVGTSLHVRHFARLDADEDAQAGAPALLLQVSAPAFGRIQAVGAAGVAAPTLIASFNESVLPVNATSVAMRRIGRQRGPITRRIAAQGGTRSPRTWIARLNTSASRVFVGHPRQDLASFEVVRQRITQPKRVRGFAAVTAKAVANMHGRPVFEIVPEGQPVKVPRNMGLPVTADNPAARSLRIAARDHLRRINPGRPTFLTAQAQPLALDRSKLLAQIEPRRTLARLAEAVVTTDGNASRPTSASTKAPVAIEPVMAAPKFRQPMYEPLRDLSQELLLPGLETVPPNTVLGLETNRRFVQAYMVGLNFEMGRELLWRGFPTDQRGTYFDQFWDTRASSLPRSDVIPLHLWETRPLGAAQLTPAGERFVMLLRSDLLRRYPNAVIYATKALKRRGVRSPSTKPTDEVHPSFRGSLRPDVSFFGFELTVDDVVGDDQKPGYFIVVQEQPTEPRFGLEVDTPRGDSTHLQVNAGLPPGLPAGGLQWGRNAAHIAGIARQQPVRVAIHASRFMVART